MDNFDVESADKAALRKYGKEVMGIDFPPATSEDTMRDRAREHLAGGKDLVADQPTHPKTVKILIPSVEGDTGSAPVFVGLNTREYLIQRDEEVTVPYGVYENLKNAREKRYRMVRNPETNKNELTFTEVSAYPVQVVI